MAVAYAVGLLTSRPGPGAMAGGDPVVPFLPTDTDFGAAESWGMTDQGPAPAPSAGAPAITPAPNRSVIVTGDISISVDDPLAAADQISTMLAAVDGRIDGRTEWTYTDDSPNTIDLVVRIPSADVNTFVEDVRTLGNVLSVSLSSEDVTMERVDLQARVDVLEDAIAVLREIATKADNVTDLLAVQAEITAQQSELDSLRNQLTVLVDQVDLATLKVALSPAHTYTKPAPGGFLDAVARGWQSLTATIGAGFLAFGEALPWLAAIALLLGFIVLAVRIRIRTRRRQRSAEMTTPVVSDGGPTMDDAADSEPVGTNSPTAG